jgi:ArsR family transcriptional regulator, arsenate/arsenite/antimonite-responsive transcriptional repressor
MDIHDAVTAFNALSQETRLRVFRLLVEHGREGAPAGVVSETLGIPHNTLSFHLSQMSHSGLVQSRRESRSIIYTANLEFFTDLIRYMVKDCCRMEFASIREDTQRGCSVIEMPSCCPPRGQENKS